MSKLHCLGLILWICYSSVGASEGIERVDPPQDITDFSLAGIDGKQHRFEDFRGKYLLVNFWAVWCAPCRAEMPSLQRAYEKLSNPGFELLAIHAGPSVETAQQYANQLNLEFPILVDQELALTGWGIRGLPSTFLIDPQGRIIAEAVGERAWDAPGMLKTIADYMRKNRAGI